MFTATELFPLRVLLFKSNQMLVFTVLSFIWLCLHFYNFKFHLLGFNLFISALHMLEMILIFGFWYLVLTGFVIFVLSL